MVTDCVFNPDYAAAPGEIIEEILEARGMTRVELALRCGLSPKTISLILSGKAPVTPDTAIQLERVLGITSSIWNNLEANYRLFLAKEKDSDELESQRNWLQGFPFREMVKRKWIPDGRSTAEKVSILLNFFGVGSVSSWEAKYGGLSVRLRGSAKYPPNREALAAWIRRCEVKANTIETEPFNAEGMNKALGEIRSLTCEDPEVFEPEMKNLMIEAGVAVVFMSELPGTHLSGATRWLTPEKAMIALSLRYKTNDQLWFTFFHEAAHLKLHSKKLSFIDWAGSTSEDVQEIEADRYACDYLIPPGIYKRFLEKGDFTSDSIRKLAAKLGITPGIIVGRLQHDGALGYNQLNYLKCRFELKE